jgi:hypothetical protein
VKLYVKLVESVCSRIEKVQGKRVEYRVDMIKVLYDVEEILVRE